MYEKSLLLTTTLFRGDYPDRHARPRQPLNTIGRCGTKRLCDAEIGDDSVHIGKQNIFRFDIAMYYPFAVCIRQRRRDFAQQVQRLSDREFAAAR